MIIKGDLDRMAEDIGHAGKSCMLLLLLRACKAPQTRARTGARSLLVVFIH